MGESHQLNTTGAGITVSKIKAPHLKAASVFVNYRLRYNKLGFKSLTSTRFELIAPKPNLLLVKRAAGETVQLI